MSGFLESCRYIRPRQLPKLFAALSQARGSLQTEGACVHHCPPLADRMVHCSQQGVQGRLVTCKATMKPPCMGNACLECSGSPAGTAAQAKPQFGVSDFAVCFGLGTLRMLIPDSKSLLMLLSRSVHSGAGLMRDSPFALSLHSNVSLCHSQGLSWQTCSAGLQQFCGRTRAGEEGAEVKPNQIDMWF